MANHKQALKRHRQSTVRRARNMATRSRLRSLIKTLREAIQAQKPKEAQEALNTVVPELDKAASKGVIPPKRASRQISRLSAAVNHLQK